MLFSLLTIGGDLQVGLISTQIAKGAAVKMAVYRKEINAARGEINTDCSATNPNRKEINTAYAEMAVC